MRSKILKKIQKALVHHQAGRLQEAKIIYQSILKKQPENPVALHLLGVVAHQTGKNETATKLIKKALALEPDYVDAYGSLGNICHETGHQEEAIAYYKQAIDIKPDCAEAYNNMGAALLALGRKEEAIVCVEEAIALMPDIPKAHNTLGVAYQELGRQGEAISHYEQALALEPDYAEAHNNQGAVFQELGQKENAIACYQQALSIRPDYAEASVSMIHQMQHICHWENIENLFLHTITMMKNGSCDINPFSFIALPTTAEQQLHCARLYIQKRTIGLKHLCSSKGSSPSHAKKTRIRLGYISADFRQHPMAYLITQTIEQHDRNYFEVIAYSFGPDDGSLERQRLIQAFDQFIDVREQSYMETAQHIHEDGIDILIDLTGYTQNCRPQILALRPAPIQINYLGYPGTMGADFMDYIITDHFISPVGYENYFSENLVRLPDCFQANDSALAISNRRFSRAECGLPEEGFVFCCFNNTFKIMPEIFEVWMQLIKAVPGSVLWLVEANEWVGNNLKAEASRLGVAGERLVFAEKLPSAEYLSRMRLADLFLDTAPYNAGTTASDALRVGLPLLTCPGETFASRMAGSLLLAIGLPELIAEDLTDYETKALELATNSDKLTKLRQQLEVNRLTTPLFDNKFFTLHLENAYRQIWDIYIAGKAPQHLDVQRLPLETQ